MNKPNSISQSVVRELFTYSEGQLLWNIRKKGIKRRQAGFKSKAGYTQIRINKKLFYLHRLVWIYHFGETPFEIDHIDGNPANNFLENLREATHQQNLSNMKKHVDNKSGYVGVTKCYNKWLAKIMIDGVAINIGSFDTPEAASDAYQKTASEHRKEFVRSNP
jgi:hypothetical protein